MRCTELFLSFSIVMEDIEINGVAYHPRCGIKFTGELLIKLLFFLGFFFFFLGDLCITGKIIGWFWSEFFVWIIIKKIRSQNLSFLGGISKISSCSWMRKFSNGIEFCITRDFTRDL